MTVPLRTVLLLGSTGFIGRAVLAGLTRSGFDVVCGVRRGSGLPECRCVEIDFRRDHSPEVWLPRLKGIDAIVNAVGILRPSADGSFEDVHVKAPVSAFEAALRAGVRKIVQISALGADREASSRYHVSKRDADDALAELPMRSVIVQPSLVFGAGGTSARFFTTLAALPVVPVPGDGRQAIQPVHVDDLVQLIVTLLRTEDHDGRRIAAVGAREMTLAEFLTVLRAAMELPPAPLLHVPMAFVRAAASLGDLIPGSLLDRETLGMLLRGNTAPAAAITALLGKTPRPPESFIEHDAARASATEARLVWLLPLLRMSIALLWIVTGLLSLGIYPAEQSYALLARVGLTGVAASFALYGAALLDVFFGIAMFAARRRRLLYSAQIALILAYTLIITLWLPEYWLHPYGPVLKNLPVLAAILILHEFDKT